MKIYILTQGCYSDYHIVTATTSKEKAERLRDAYIKAHGSDTWYSDHIYIEEFEDGDINDMRLNYDIIAVPRYNDFKFIDFEYSAFVLDHVDSDTKFNEVKKYSGYGRGHGHYCITVKATDIEEAIKIGQDLINMYRAKEEGIC